MPAQEFDTIKTHPLIGEKLIEEHPLSGLVCKPIVEHHERLDGKGYPYGLAEDQIALPSRIVGISDALDAMTSTRPYRKALPQETALELLERGAGSQFDPWVDVALQWDFQVYARHPAFH
jgi:HD-GYP domain-containing protein (c-di-GMP phosphodiesterase class II)